MENGAARAVETAKGQTFRAEALAYMPMLRMAVQLRDLSLPKP